VLAFVQLVTDPSFPAPAYGTVNRILRTDYRLDRRWGW
jgi:hypothetical protein